MNVTNVVTISDTHCGCQLSICPPTGVRLDEGGVYTPSKFQAKLYDIWDYFWNTWLPSEIGDEPFILVHNGDVIDGKHHDSTTQITQNLEDQANIAYELLAPIVDRSSGYFHIRGTEAHVGKSGIEEERLAKRLGAKPNSIGQHARYDLWLQLGGHYINFLHHISTVSSNAYESSAVGKELNELINECGRWGVPIPTAAVRSHRHRHCEVKVPTAKGESFIYVTPAWQLKTPFAYKIAGARTSSPQIGGSLIRLHHSGVLYTRHFVRPIERSEIEVLDGPEEVTQVVKTAKTNAAGYRGRRTSKPQRSK